MAWIATYAVHSTLILSRAWLLLRVWRPRPDPALRDLVWKIALAAGLVTATLHSTGLVAPSVGPFETSGLVELRRWNGMPVIPAAHDIIPSSGARVFGARLPDAAALLRLARAASPEIGPAILAFLRGERPRVGRIEMAR
ncbi:MAG: hypothetical protein WKG32_16735 [Gemmatimonadaceae bacterium]